MLVGGTAEVQVRDSCTLTFVRGETRPVLGGFWDSVLRVPTPFDVERPNSTW